MNKKLYFETLSKKEKAEIIMYLRDQAHDMEIDRESMLESFKFDFVGAIESLADYLEQNENN